MYEQGIESFQFLTTWKLGRANRSSLLGSRFPTTLFQVSEYQKCQFWRIEFKTNFGGIHKNSWNSHENKDLLCAFTSPFNSVCAKYVDPIWKCLIRTALWFSFKRISCNILSLLETSIFLREVCKKSKWKFKMAFAIRRPTPPPLNGKISRHFFTPLFFFCNWILHIWNGFYTSKISLLSPLIIGSKLTFISSSGRWLPTI